jgi:hypothetical protein
VGRACSTYGENSCAYRVLVEKPELKRPLGRSRHKWKDNIKMYLQKEGCGRWTGLIWIGTDGGHL